MLFDKAQLLKLRKRTVLLESMRAALPREITSNEPLDPLSVNRRPTVDQIGQQWARAQPVGRQKERTQAPAPEGGTELERAHGKAPPAPEKNKGPWERGMSVPQRQALEGGKVWDDVDAETFGEHDASAALSNWADQAKAFEAEMQAMRAASGGKLPGEQSGPRPDIFGAAFSDAPDVTDQPPAATGQEDAEELAQRKRAAAALQALEAAAAKPPPPARARAPAADDGRWRVLPWFYRDPQGAFQGPFEATQMRQWFQAGYFDDDLPLRQGTSGDFFPLKQLFTNPPGDAFVTKPKNLSAPSPAPAPPPPPPAPGMFGRGGGLVVDDQPPAQPASMLAMAPVVVERFQNRAPSIGISMPPTSRL